MLTIVFHDDSGEISTLEGMPSGDPFFGDAGTIIAWGPHSGLKDTIDDIRNQGLYNAIFATILEGKDACRQWACLIANMTRLDNMDVRYNPSGANSNAAVYTVLSGCKLPLSWPGTQGHPGWGIDLFTTPVPNPVPTPVPTGTPTPPST